MYTALISSKLALHRLATGRPSRIATALTLLKQMLFKYVLFFKKILITIFRIYTISLNITQKDNSNTKHFSPERNIKTEIKTNN